jgi:hypothetical protein
MKTPRPPAEPPAGPRGSRKIKFPISYLNGLIDPARSDKLNIGGARPTGRKAENPTACPRRSDFLGMRKGIPA